MENEETVLSLQFVPEAQIELAAFTQQLALLPKNTAQGFLDKFLGLLDSARLEIGVPSVAAATGASDHVIGLRIAGYRELVAAAFGAGECKT